jgi:CubicO group peptidase (beta-lactamase class C family)
VKNAISFVLFIILLFPGCTQNNNKKAAAQLASAGTEILSAANSKIPPHELKVYLSRVQDNLDSLFRRTRFNGSLLVAKHGQVIYETYNGYFNPRTKTDTITASTPFHLASVSKTFTSMAILRLHEQGRLNIDDTVNKHLAGFPCEGVTIRTLLNHRSGIPKYDHYMENMGWDKKKLVTNQDVLDFIIARHKDIRIARPNRGFSYSNTNYALLALIIEKVSGLSYGNFLKQTFFDPLGMKDSYVFTMSDTGRYLPSYYYSGRLYQFDYLDLVYGDKNVYSTVRDLLKWDQALRNDSLFTKQSLEAAYMPYSFEKPGTHNYGLGWRMYLLKNGKKLVYHNGWWHGNRTAFYRLLDEDVTIIALCNNDARKVYSVKEMADIFGDYMQKRDRSDDDDVTIRRSSRSRNSGTAYLKKKKSIRSRLTAKK